MLTLNACNSFIRTVVSSEILNKAKLRKFKTKVCLLKTQLNSKISPVDQHHILLVCSKNTPVKETLEFYSCSIRL